MKQESSKKAKNSEYWNFSILIHFFYMTEQKIDPPNLGFWTLTFTFFHIILATFQKKELRANETGKFKEGKKIVKILKFFNFKSFFLSDGAKNRPAQPRFLNSYFQLLPYYSCDVSKK